jgi:hypothetical protein
MAWARLPRHGVLEATAPSLSTGEPRESSRRVGGVPGKLTSPPSAGSHRSALSLDAVGASLVVGAAAFIACAAVKPEP